MQNSNLIYNKLNNFVKKYYVNELLKGLILFFSLGLFYFLITMLIEHFLWLSPVYRTVLFWSFILVELFLLIKFILIPILKIIGLKKGISYNDASKIIGNHFPEVSDKLLNYLQLSNTDSNSELLLASIDQKANDLKPVPFKLAIDFTSNKSYLKYLAIPLLIYLCTLFFGDNDLLSNSYDRVVNYEKAYVPPAPYKFIVLNDNLTIQENSPFTLKVQAVGKSVPSSASILVNNTAYILKSNGNGFFEYNFDDTSSSVNFKITTDKVNSKDYILNIIKTPLITEFKMYLNYPSYTNLKDELLTNSGNAKVPYGTNISWYLETQHTSDIIFTTNSSEFPFKKDNDKFKFSKKASSNFIYEILTSNKNIKNYDKLSYNVDIITDEHPSLDVTTKKDSLLINTYHHFTIIKDDYGFSKYQLVYYPVDNEKDINIKKFNTNKSTYQENFYTFPNDLELESGKKYAYYFQVFDNDYFNNYKSIKSKIFIHNELTKLDIDDKLLNEQNKSIEKLDKSLQNLSKQKKQLENISRTNKENKDFNFNQKQKLQDFIKKQEQQDEMMKNFSKKLDNNLDKLKEDSTLNDEKDDLQEKLNETQEEIDKKQKILDELKELQDKLTQEELSKKLDDLSKMQEQQERSLEQILELTKRFYVKQKFEKIADKLSELAKEQEELSKQDSSKEEQDKLNDDFKDIQKELKDLEEKNNELKSPMDLDSDKKKEDSIKEDQEKASDNLSQDKQKQAQKQQKSASDKMKEMSKKMKSKMSKQQQSQNKEDEKTLRQILDNLLTFSFDEEDLMKDISSSKATSLSFSKKIMLQNDLKDHFKHIDDSIFALASRNSKIKSVVNKEITDVHFNLNKALDLLSENKINQSTVNQQYAVVSANNLAQMLSQSLQSMQESSNMDGLPSGASCPNPGGSGQGFQLSDIIKEQEGNLKKMKDGLNKKQGKGKPGDEGEPKEGEGDKPGEKGKKPGENGKNGEEGMSEEESGELYTIYKKQQDLKNQLINKLKEYSDQEKVEKLIKKMEDLENKLLEKGFSNDVFNQMKEINYELLKVDEALFKQGKESERESNLNKKSFDKNPSSELDYIKKYFNRTEILNKDNINFSNKFKNKVKDYFKY